VIDCLVNTVDELKDALFGIAAVNDKGQAKLLTQPNKLLKRVFLLLTLMSRLDMVKIQPNFADCGC
jgi:4-hydroxy-3-methylbut-2-en-1-yl diphosphate synthase IspG/GcpE